MKTGLVFKYWHWWIGILSLLLLAAGADWFFDHHRWERLEKRVGASIEARRNPWLAAERFLQRLEVAVESLSGRRLLLQPPAEGGVIIVKRLGRPLAEPQVQALVDWIEAGGNLVLRARNSDLGARALLERFGIETGRLDWGESTLGDEADQAEEDRLAEFSYPDYPQSLQVQFESDWYLQENGALRADLQIENFNGPQLLQLRLGDGRLTLLTEMEWMDNEHIGHLDHALLLAILVGEAPRVWLLHGGAQPGVLALLWQRAPALTATLLSLLVLGVWRLGRRSGPKLPAPAPVRRDLLEHLQAAAQYAWQTDRAVDLLADTRRRLLEYWQQRHPQLERMGRQERSAWLAERNGLAARELDQALYGEIETEDQLVRASALLRRLMSGSASVINRKRR